MKYKKIVALIIMLMLTLVTLTGCEYFDVQKEQQEFNEDTIDYLNEKYSRESSFKKYERKDIKKTIGNNTISEFVCYRIFGPGGSGCPSFEFGKSTKIIMKDGTVVLDAKYDNRQVEKIKSDFEDYHRGLFKNYDYADNVITFLSGYDPRFRGIKANYDGIFNKYYDGNMKQFLEEQEIYANGVIVIWIDEDEWEEECLNIAREFEGLDSKLSINERIYFMDRNMKNKVDGNLIFNNGTLINENQKGLLGYLYISRSSEYSNYYKYKKVNEIFNEEEIIL